MSVEPMVTTENAQEAPKVTEFEYAVTPTAHKSPSLTDAP